MSAAAETGEARLKAAAIWCDRLAEGFVNLEEQIAFETWLDADPLNRPTFERMAAIWHSAAEAADVPELIGVRVEALEAFRAARRRGWLGRLARGWQPIAALAACLALVLAGTLLFLRNGADVYVTGIGERRVVRLEDGSRLSLDAATRVEVSYSGERRSLRLLAGRAKFDVMKDPRRPFSVTAGDRVVVATGTAFSVELVQRQMRVVLYEGNVAVIEDGPGDRPPKHIALASHPGEAAQSLKPGNALVAALDRPVARIEAADPVRSLAWEGGQLYFSDEPLALAAERANRYSDIKIVPEGRAGQILISGAFNAGDAEGFADGVGTLYALRIVRSGDRITLREAGATR